MITVHVVRNMTGLVCAGCGGVIGAKDAYVLQVEREECYHSPPCAEKKFGKEVVETALKEIPHGLELPDSEKSINEKGK